MQCVWIYRSEVGAGWSAGVLPFAVVDGRFVFGSHGCLSMRCVDLHRCGLHGLVLSLQPLLFEGLCVAQVMITGVCAGPCVEYRGRFDFGGCCAAALSDRAVGLAAAVYRVGVCREKAPRNERDE